MFRVVAWLVGTLCVDSTISTDPFAQVQVQVQVQVTTYTTDNLLQEAYRMLIECALEASSGGESRRR